MENTNKESDALKRKIRKVWLPVLLCILIVLNLTIAPKLLSHYTPNYQPVSVENSNIQIPPSIPLETLPPSSSSSVSGEPKNEKPIVLEPTKEEKEKKTNKNEKPVPQPQNNKKNKKPRFIPSSHGQSRNFRFFLFFLVILITGLIFVLIVTKTERNFEYSKARSNTITIDNNAEMNGYHNIPDRPYESYDHI